MVKKDGAQTRAERIKEIAQMIQATFQQLIEKGEKPELPLSKTIGKIMFNMGLQRDTVIEYLEIIQDNDQIEIDYKNDKIKKPEF